MFVTATRWRRPMAASLLARISSDNGKVFVELIDDCAGGEDIRVVNIDSGYQVALAETLAEVMQSYDYSANEESVMRLYQAFFTGHPTWAA